MPISVDASRPVRTVDTSGNTISTDTGRAAPIKTVDSVGRSIQADATKVAEQAAAANPEFSKNDNGVANDNDSKVGNDNAEKPSEAAKRREWLQIQKLKRSIAEKEKAAGENLKRAEGFARVRALAESGEDPTAILREAGLDEAKYYQKLTEYALSDKAKRPEDPVTKELREHKERLDKYAKDLEVQTKTLEEEKALSQHNRAISDHVIPLLQNNPDRYEAIFAEYGQNAAVEVYKTVWEIYQQTGKARKFEEVADEMEAYWSETIDKGIEAASKLKKFQNRFAQSGNGQGHSVGRTETPRSVTLRNRPAAVAPPESAPGSPYRGMTRDERVAAILKKFA
jgi:hypothetical protein